MMIIDEGSAFENIARMNMSKKKRHKLRGPSPFEVTDKIYREMREDTQSKVKRLSRLYRRSPGLFEGEALADITFDDIPPLKPINDETSQTMEAIIEREKTGRKEAAAMLERSIHCGAINHSIEAGAQNDGSLFITEPSKAKPVLSPEEIKQREMKAKNEMMLRHVKWICNTDGGFLDYKKAGLTQHYLNANSPPKLNLRRFSEEATNHSIHLPKIEG